LGAKGIPYGQWKNIRLNKYGFHDSDSLDKSHKEKAVRIMCLGDSITFGTSTAPFNWPQTLEEELTSQNLDVEVINAAFPMNNYRNLIARFEAEYVEFNPDIVIIYKGFRLYMKGNEPYQGGEGKWTKALRMSTFVRQFLDKEPEDPYQCLIKRRKKFGIKKIVRRVSKENLSNYERDLLHLFEVCKKNNIVLVVSPFLSLTNKYNKADLISHAYRALYYYPSVSVDAYLDGKQRFNAVTQGAAQKHSITYVEVGEGIECTEEYFLDDYHLTVKGSKRVGKNYAKALSKLVMAQFPESILASD
jgi:lysophospholipase L1-like esterase